MDEQHSTFDPTQVHKSIYGSHAYYDRPGGSVYIAVVPSTGRPTDCSILIAKVADERCAAVGSASCSP